MKSRLEKIYNKQAYFPGWIGVFVNPFYIARSGLRDAMVRFSPMLSGRLLDVGCGKKPYKKLFEKCSYIGLDIDSDITRKRGVADYFYDGKTFPFKNEEFDSILCNQVLEHVFNPDEFLGELERVLKPNGRLLLTVPFVWDEHEQPYDFARYSSYGLNALLKQNGFRIIEYQKICADMSIIFQLTNAYFYKVSSKLSMPFRIVVMVTVMAFINILGVLLARLMPGNPDLFLDQVVLAEKVA